MSDDDATQAAIEAADAAIDSYLDQVDWETDGIDTRDLAENVVLAIDAALAGRLLAAFNADMGGVVAAVRELGSRPPAGFRRD